MKRLIRKSESEKYEIYKSVINTLMSNDHNGSWDEIYADYMDRYDNADMALNESISEVIEALQRILNEDLDPQGDKEEYDFYNDQLNKLKVL